MFCFIPPARTEIYTLSLHDALPIYRYSATRSRFPGIATTRPRPSTNSSTAQASTQPLGALEELVEGRGRRSEEHTSELQSQFHLVCRLLLEKKKRDLHTAPSSSPPP